MKNLRAHRAVERPRVAGAGAGEDAEARLPAAGLLERREQRVRDGEVREPPRARVLVALICSHESRQALEGPFSESCIKAVSKPFLPSFPTPTPKTAGFLGPVLDASNAWPLRFHRAAAQNGRQLARALKTRSASAQAGRSAVIAAAADAASGRASPA